MRRKNNFKKEYEDEEISAKEKLFMTDDNKFITNLFLMIRTKRYDFKMLVKSLKLMNVKNTAQLVKSYGISEELITKILDLVNQEKDPEVSASILEKYIIEQYEINKNNKKEENKDLTKA